MPPPPLHSHILRRHAYPAQTSYAQSGVAGNRRPPGRIRRHAAAGRCRTESPPHQETRYETLIFRPLLPSRSAIVPGEPAPRAPIFDVVAQHWPFALIAWGLLHHLA